MFLSIESMVETDTHLTSTATVILSKRHQWKQTSVGGNMIRNRMLA